MFQKIVVDIKLVLCFYDLSWETFFVPFHLRIHNQTIDKKGDDSLRESRMQNSRFCMWRISPSSIVRFHESLVKSEPTNRLSEWDATGKCSSHTEKFSHGINFGHDWNEHPSTTSIQNMDLDREERWFSPFQWCNLRISIVSNYYGKRTSNAMKVIPAIFKRKIMSHWQRSDCFRNTRTMTLIKLTNLYFIC